MAYSSQRRLVQMETQRTSLFVADENTKSIWRLQSHTGLSDIATERKVKVLIYPSAIFPPKHSCTLVEFDELKQKERVCWRIELVQAASESYGIAIRLVHTV